jgi:transposase
MMTTEQGKERKTYKESEKFKIGCRAAAGISVREIAEHTGMSREYIYQQKEMVETYAGSLDEAVSEHRQIELDAKFKERTILSLALDCSSPIEGIQRFFKLVCGIDVSIGYISGVLKKSGGTRPKI